MFVFLIILLLAIVALLIASQWIVFKKAGRHGWAAIVPIYCNIVSLQVAKLSPWLIFIYLAAIIPIVGSIVVLAFNIFVTIRMGKAFGKGVGFIIGLILLPIIFMPILAFGSSKYQFDDKQENADTVVAE